MPNRCFLVLLLSWWVVRAALSSQAATTTPGKRGSLWRTRLSETFPCHFDFTGLAHSPFFLQDGSLFYALKLGEEALGTLGRFGSRFHFLAVARQEVPGALTSEPRESYLFPSQTRHASTPRTPRRFPGWLHIGSR